MFCRECGREIEDNVKFCGYCGAPVEVVKQNVVPNSISEQKSVEVVKDNAVVNNDEMKSVTQPVQISFKINPKIVLGCVAVVFILIISIFTVVYMKSIVKLEDYITVTYDGYDTVGKVSVDFDYDKFAHKYAKKLRNPKNYKDWEKQLMQLESDSNLARYFFDYYISYEFSEKDGLSNGEEICMTWNCRDEDVLKEYGLKLAHKDKVFKVKDLEQATVIDPFAEAEISFHGVSPFGQVDVKYDGSDNRLKDLRFAVNNGYTDVANGDTVIVKVLCKNKEAKKDSFIEEGIILETLQKEITITGLDEYVRGIDVIRDEVFTGMNEQMIEDDLENFSDSRDIKRTDIIGRYLLVDKEEWKGQYNRLVYIYEVEAEVSSDDYHENVIYYYPITYYNVSITKDNNILYENIEWMYDSFQKKYSDDYWDYFYINGYENLKDVVEDYVLDVNDRYDVSTDEIGEQVIEDSLNGAYELSSEGKQFLNEMVYILPEFSNEQDMNIDFWNVFYNNMGFYAGYEYFKMEYEVTESTDFAGYYIAVSAEDIKQAEQLIFGLEDTTNPNKLEIDCKDGMYNLIQMDAGDMTSYRYDSIEYVEKDIYKVIYNVDDGFDGTWKLEVTIQLTDNDNGFIIIGKKSI